jgi:hypothetical protein
MASRADGGPRRATRAALTADAKATAATSGATEARGAPSRVDERTPASASSSVACAWMSSPEV